LNTTPAVPPELSVVLCTYNPRRPVLARALDGLRSQTLPLDRWELVVIDNNSDSPLSAADLDGGRGLPLRVVRETRQGKVPAHRRGILEARAELLVLMDDDNVFEPEYLERALAIARAEPSLGAFGGIARPVIDGGPLARWQQRLLPYIGVRDYGAQPITSREDRWGPWEPIGAGMVLQRRVGLEFVRVVDSVPEAAELDRIGRALLSAGDSLLARLSYPLGLACSYQPALAFDHLIPRSRVGVHYLRRMMYGHGRSLVKLNRVLGVPSEPLSVWRLMGRMLTRVRHERLGGPLWWCWDLGYFVECRRRRRKEYRPAS
jgi:glycosyltransferase involved in cell wall biosynthesis